ncbi:MAG: patatin-like phospholipase family protein [Synergistaceae bacterium]
MNKILRIKFFSVFVILIICLVFPNIVYALSPNEKEHNKSWGFRHKEGIVLVFSGGGTKGLAHIGVLKVLERENIPIAAIVGTSMGSIIGGIYASGYTAEEMEKLTLETSLTDIVSGRSSTASPIDMSHNPPVSGSQLLTFQMTKGHILKGRTGLLNPKNLYSFLSDKTSRATVTNFDELHIPFAAVATDLETGEEVILRDGNLASALRASMSIPGVFDPWEMDGRLLVDGGLKANLPVKIAKKLFPGHPVVAVNLSPQNIKRNREQLRSLLEVGAQTLEILMIEQVRENVKEADLVIAPKVSEFGILDSSGYDKIIAKGVEATEPLVSELHKLVDSTLNSESDEIIKKPAEQKTLYVDELRFEGVPKNIVESLNKRYSGLIGKPLNMAEVAKAVKELSLRPEFLSVEGRVEKRSRKTATVIFTMQRPPKYEFTLNGYVGNIHSDSWVSISAQVRDMLMDGDVGSLEYRLGNRWGVKGKYFTALSGKRSQFGFLLSAVNEGISPRGESLLEYERYTGRAFWYKELGSHTRFGLGYTGERINDFDTEHGFSAMVTYNNLDDQLLPTRGLSIKADAWYPFGETLISNVSFHYYLPAWRKWKLILSGGLKTGDESYFPYAAFLGNREELYSLSKNPLYGDQAYWVHLGAEKTILRSWWGGLNAELFANYGHVFSNWVTKTTHWETGVALSLPTNNFAGKLFVVYDQNDEFTFGYSFGIPSFWNGPLQ